MSISKMSFLVAFVFLLVFIFFADAQSPCYTYLYETNKCISSLRCSGGYSMYSSSICNIFFFTTYCRKQVCCSGYGGSSCLPQCTASCYGQGTCVSPNVCYCATGWSGSYCNVPVCSTACQNGGTCSNPNTCTCTSSYNGTACETPVCSPSCLNGGKCSAPNTCSCTKDWNGSTCATPVCKSGCLYGGCTTPGTCVCTNPSQYNGTLCDQPVCSSACKNGGVCSAPNTCTCTSEWTGSTCQTPVCSPSCQNGGTCVRSGNSNVCSCNTNLYTGTSCQTPVCSNACLNGGNCTSPGVCTCPTSTYLGVTYLTFNGSQCQNPVCNPPCKNGGVCKASTNGTANYCSCNATMWSGSTCEKAVCTSGCSHGNCSTPQTCNCFTGWSGPTCGSSVCTAGCAGYCTTPSTCLCFAGYNGTLCDKPICQMGCGTAAQGNCTAPDTCTCTAGLWKGSNCSTPICSSTCSPSNGYCNTPGQCLCKTGWSGSDCKTPVCDNGCANGNCTLPNQCTCKSGWLVNGGTGSCTEAICKSGCAHGTCVNSPGMCYCDAGYVGELCQYPISTAPAFVGAPYVSTTMSYSFTSITQILRVTATPEAPNTITYSISGANSSYFLVDPNTGGLYLNSNIIFFNTSGVLHPFPENTSSVSMTVRATDSRATCYHATEPIAVTGGCYTETTIIITIAWFSQSCPTQSIVKTGLSPQVQTWTAPTPVHPGYLPLILTTNYSSSAFGTFVVTYTASNVDVGTLSCSFNVIMYFGMTTELGSVAHVFEESVRDIGNQQAVDNVLMDVIIDNSQLYGGGARTQVFTGRPFYQGFSFQLFGESNTALTLRLHGLKVQLYFNLEWCSAGSLNADPAFSLRIPVVPILEASVQGVRSVQRLESSEGSYFYTMERGGHCLKLVGSSTAILSDLNIDFFSLRVDPPSLQSSTTSRRSINTISNETFTYYPSSTTDMYVLYTPQSDNSSIVADPGTLLNVRDLQPPTWVSCNTSTVKVYASTGSPLVSVSWVAPEATDNVGIQGMTSNYAIGSNFSIFQSPYTVVYTANDTSGLKATCSFKIEVLHEPVAFSVSIEVTDELLPFSYVTRPGRLTSSRAFISSSMLGNASFNPTVHDAIEFNLHPPVGELFQVLPSKRDSVLQVEVDLFFLVTHPNGTKLGGNNATFGPLYPTIVFHDAERLNSSIEEPLALDDRMIADLGSSYDAATSVLRLYGATSAITDDFTFSSLSILINYIEGFRLDGVSSIVLQAQPLSFGSFNSYSVVSEATLTFLLDDTTFFGIQDVQAPSFGSTCPDPIARDSGDASFVNVTWTKPTPTDNRGTADLFFGCTYEVVALFPVGKNNVTCVAIDLAGNAAVCTFEVAINDTSPPVLVCPPFASFDIDSASTNYSTLTDGDLTPISILDNDFNTTTVDYSMTPHVYTVGYHTAPIYAHDRAGNMASCDFSFRVVDTAPPSFPGCPKSNITGLVGSIVIPWEDLTPVDNHGISRIESSHNQSSPILAGTTIISLRAFDLSNNTATCNFTVIASAVSTSSSSVLSSTSNVAALGIGIVVAIVLLVVFMVLYARRLRRKQRDMPHDFESILKLLRTMELSNEEGEGPIKPREIARSAVTVLEDLGKGNFGAVSKGILEEKNSVMFMPSVLVAIKSLKEGSSSERTELLEEAAVMAQFRHPNVVGLVGVVTVGDPLLIILEYMEKGSLQSFLQKNEVTIQQQLEFATDTAAGLCYLSSRGFVHRDVAARNVLLNSELKAKISDFGMSRDTSATDSYYTSRGGNVPVRWSAPECLEDHKYSQASDVWAYGVMLYEIWTQAKLPYQGWSNQKVWIEICAGYRLPSPSGCPPHVYMLMLDCWKSDPHERPKFSQIPELLRDDRAFALSDGPATYADFDLEEDKECLATKSVPSPLQHQSSLSAPNPYQMIENNGTPSSSANQKAPGLVQETSFPRETVLEMPGHDYADINNPETFPNYVTEEEVFRRSLLSRGNAMDRSVKNAVYNPSVINPTALRKDSSQSDSSRKSRPMSSGLTNELYLSPVPADPNTPESPVREAVLDIMSDPSNDMTNQDLYLEPTANPNRAPSDPQVIVPTAPPRFGATQFLKDGSNVSLPLDAAPSPYDANKKGKLVHSQSSFRFDGIDDVDMDGLPSQSRGSQESYVDIEDKI